MNLSVLASYGRSFLATTLTAVFAIGKLPTEFTSADWATVSNAIWIAVIPVVIRYLNPNDATFGIKK